MIDQLFMQDLARDLAPPLEPVEQPATLLAAGPATSDVGQVTVQGYNESKPSGVRVGRAGISPEQSAKAGGLDRPLVALLDTLAGALKGATAQTLGLPGDIRSILDLISQEGATKYLGEPVMPTTEQMQDILPAVVPQGVANQADREYTAKMASEIGTFLPAPGIPEAAVQGVKAVTKAVKATKGLPVGMSIQDVSNVVEDYRGQHTAPMKDSGAPLNDVTGGGSIYPEDIYGPNGVRYYGDGSPMDNSSFAIVRQFKNKPDATVTIYRAIPSELTNAEKLAKLEKDMAAYMKRNKLPEDAFTSDGNKWYDWAYEEKKKLLDAPEEEKRITPKINVGDWVTINRDYAKEHGQSALQGNYKIISKKVKASEIYTNGDSIHEWGYDPKGKENK